MNSIPSQRQQSQSTQQPQSVTTISSPTELTPATQGAPVRSHNIQPLGEAAIELAARIRQFNSCRCSV